MAGLQTALDLKAPSASPVFTGATSGITKATIGLGNVDNTADLDKPSSTATQTCLDAKTDKTNTYTKGDVDLNISNLIASAPRILEHTKRVGAGASERPKSRDHRLRSASNKGVHIICRRAVVPQGLPVHYIH